MLIHHRTNPIQSLQVKQINEDAFNAAYSRYKLRKITKKDLAAELGISRPTLDKLLKEKGL